MASLQMNRRSLLAAAAIATLSLSLSGCDEPPADSNVVDVTVGGKVFHLELALDDQSRFKGLSGRTEIKADGGMLFVFPRSMKREFVMRDCPVAIDIIFLDGSGRIVAMHNMQPETARTKEEETLNTTGVNDTYEKRLKKYSSKYACQFVIELKGGTINAGDDTKPGLKLAESEKIELDLAALKKRAK
jgi:uncharacterized membrane protein (UPF0127 family)